ncbi:MAG: hydroxymethylglutaryl-CoA lyase [Candidatus Kapabacteria bacterium]|jgi:hydroxymethylglutaryl-CoA lyase|nr:hydroxymethylglutaryl-CoA lyase [Candidatus Kapabacteria bacterium]
MAQLPKHVIIEEQGLRDGLQTETTIVPTEMKLQMLKSLVESGLRRIQVCSFVNPKLVPQMADAEELCKQLPSLFPEQHDVLFSALTLNTKGVERAYKAGLKHISVSLSASDTHSRKNTGKSLAEARAEFKEMVNIALDAGLQVRGGIQSAFGCRYEGHISEDIVLDLVKHHLAAGVHEIGLADSTGMGNPVAVRRVMTEIVQLANGKPVILHQHDTENKGLANLYAALEAGVSIFDTAFGGLGGCPFIKGATGNIATEDTAHLLHQMGIATGIDVKRVAAVSSEFAQFLKKPLPGKMYSIVQRDDIRW